MIGNNSCGASAQAYGKTVDNVRRLEVMTYDGLRMWVGPTSEAERARIAAEGGRKAEIYAGLDRIAGEYMADIRRGFPQIPRRVSGYNLDSLLPENGFDVARASSAARAPWSPSCAPNSNWCRSPRTSRCWCSATRTSPAPATTSPACWSTARPPSWRRWTAGWRS